MDHLIQNGLFNLEIETQHPHSSSSSSQNEGVERNWVELPPDVTTLIFFKLGIDDILDNAQWVCTSWWKLSKQPHLFHSISMQILSVPVIHDVSILEKTILDYICAPESFRKKKRRHLVKMAKEAVDRSCGQLLEIFVMNFATDELLYYISQRSKSLKFLGLASCDEVTDDGLIQVCKQFPELEELELYGCSFSEGVFQTVGRLCPHLKSFQLNYLFYTRPYVLNGVALVIAEAMPQLCHLNLFGNRLTDDGLRAILCGCPHLQSLDLRRCFNLNFEGDLKEIMPANIKLRLPNDSVEDVDYDFETLERSYHVDEDNFYYVEETDYIFYHGNDD